jgi:hypothetical protein
MHVLHWIAVQANSPEEAARNTNDYLEAYQSPWYDWYIVGGGRWNVAEDERWTEAYTDNKLNMIISKEVSPEKFNEKLTDCMNSKLEQFKHLKKRWFESNISIMDVLNTYDGEARVDINIWTLYSLLEMIVGSWTSDSYYYDASNDGSNPNWCKNSKHDNWYLVPVDFHY